MPNECEAWLPDGSDLVAEEMWFVLGWNSTTTTVASSSPATNHSLLNRLMDVNLKASSLICNCHLERGFSPSQWYTCALFFTACSIFLVYLDDVMRAFEKIKELVIWDWYFSGRMETSSRKKKGNERKECRNISQKLCVHTVNGQTNKH